MAFLANLTGAGITTGVNSEELVAGTPGNLSELVREGDVVDGLTVNGFGLLTGSGGQDGKGTIFNDLTEVGYRCSTSVAAEPDDCLQRDHRGTPS